MIKTLLLGALVCLGTMTISDCSLQAGDCYYGRSVGRPLVYSYRAPVVAPVPYYGAYRSPAYRSPAYRTVAPGYGAYPSYRAGYGNYIGPSVGFGYRSFPGYGYGYGRSGISIGIGF